LKNLRRAGSLSLTAWRFELRLNMEISLSVAG
jgi:hypothetical protein